MDSDRQSISSFSSRQHTFERPGSDIKKAGSLKKLKTMKKKYFVLRSTSSSGPARLEYYDSEKKFKSGQLPKRSIHLHTCFNINKKSDSRHGKHGIALYTSDDCFTVLTDSEQEQESWLSLILDYQNEYLPDGDMHKEHYENVWQVTLQPRGLGQEKGTKGQYRLCLNSTTVSLVKINSVIPQFTIQLVTIRSVAHHESSFRLEVGNYAPTGAGEFWFTVEDANIAKDMHATLLHYMNSVKDPNIHKIQQSAHIRTKRDHHPRPVTYCPQSSHDSLSPSSPNYPQDYSLGAHRLRSDSRTSRTSKIGFSDDTSPDFMTGYNGEHLDVVVKEHCSVVPADMSPPPSPSCLDEEITAYVAMDMKNHQGSAPPSTHSAPYMAMDAQGPPHKSEINSSYPDTPSMGYMAMAAHHAPPPSHPIPIHAHSFSEPLHSTHLPTVKEGGSNEGYLPMDVPSSPASSTGYPRPEPATCLLSDDSTGLPPRTYSLGSKPNKKFSGYMEMGLNKDAGNDMCRATSAPHILKGRKEREHRNDSPTPSASPLSISLKSDDSDSFMQYMPMRPRTASDSFNYRTRTSSLGKIQQSCRPRSSSHGQGTRPFINFSKLTVDKARTSQEPSQRISRESSLQGSFDSLHISNESLRRMSQEMRQTSGSNASDYAEMRSTPSPQLKNMKPEPDGYMSMQVGGGRRSSPHRIRKDSSGSVRQSDSRTTSSDRLHQQPHLQQINDYTEMVPLSTVANVSGDSYMNMEYNARHSFIGDSRSVPSVSALHSSHQEDPKYMNMHLDDKSKKGDGNRSLSMENVDTYVVYDPQGGNKPRTGSLGSKDKTVSRPNSARKSSSASASSSSSSPSSSVMGHHHQHHHHQPSASASTRTGGSSDSIRKASRQSSMEKFGSLGKDFRKKSGSTGSRPSNARSSFSSGKEQHSGSSIVPVRKSSASKLTQDELADEYIEFSPTLTETDIHHHQHSNFAHPGPLNSTVPLSNSGRAGHLAASGSFSSSRSGVTPSPAEENAYTLYNPAAASSSRAVHVQQAQCSHGIQPQAKFVPSHSPSSSAHVKPFASKDASEYVGFEPGQARNTLSVSSYPSSGIKQVEAKETPQYVGFEPGVRPHSAAAISPSSQPKLVSAKSREDYVGFEPAAASHQRAHKPSTPSSAVSYIQSSEDLGSAASARYKEPGQRQIVSGDVGAHPGKCNSLSGSINPHVAPSSSLTCDPRSQAGSSVSASWVPPPVPALSAPVPQQSSSASKAVAQSGSEYLSFSPAGSSASKPRHESTGSEAVPSASSPLTNAKPQLTQLSIDVSEEWSAAPPLLKGKDNGSSPKDQQKQKASQSLKPQQPLQNFQRQLSAPASPCSPFTRPETAESQLKPLSPLLLSPDTTSSTRSKHFSCSSVLDSPSPTESVSRHKHWSGSSNSSQKCRRVSSDTERTSRKGTKSDSNSSINSVGAKSKLRHSGGGNVDDGSLSQKGPEMCPSLGFSLEAKLIPAEAKIRHSLVDVALPGAGAVNSKGCSNQQALVRPDSTPCIQNLAAAADQGSRSAGDTPSATPRSGGLQLHMGSRSRHSLSDLGTYQQLASVNSEYMSSPGSRSGANSSSGSNESSASSTTDQLPKPLNYVKLDLGCSEGQGDSEGKSRAKSRNSSDADEKQLPLSYAEIDFVRSQNLSKALAMGNPGDSISKC